MRKKKKKIRIPVAIAEDATLRAKDVETVDDGFAEDETAMKKRTAYILLNGAPTLVVNVTPDGKYRLLTGTTDFLAAKAAGIDEFKAKIYHFDEREGEIFGICETLKNSEVGTMEAAYLMKRLVSDFGRTQEEIAAATGKSRPAVANTLRLLTLSPEVIGLVESGKLSAGHARALVPVPKEKQFAFAEEAIKRDYSVRETERAVKTFLTPPEILQTEKAAAAAAKSERLKAFVERMRTVFRTKVSLIGNDKKGRIYIDYYSAEDLYRFEEFLDMIESFDRREE